MINLMVNLFVVIKILYYMSIATFGKAAASIRGYLRLPHKYFERTIMDNIPLQVCTAQVLIT
jgi:hypothetical protein